MAAENALLEPEVVKVPAINKIACRKRKPNFSEIAIITQTFEENQAVQYLNQILLTQPLTNAK